MVINQNASIGDILFCEPIFRHFFLKNKEKPIVPLRDHLMWLADYIDSATFVPMSEFSLDYDSIETENTDYLPLRFANQIVRNLDKSDHSDYSNTMPDKYELAKLPLELWTELKINFNFDKARELCMKLNVDGKEKYILVNNHSQAGDINIIPKNENNYKVVYMENIPGYTLIDWCMVMLYAEENHHISTSTLYLLQAIKNKYSTLFASKIFLYPRPNEDGLQGISKLNPTFEYTLCK